MRTAALGLVWIALWLIAGFGFASATSIKLDGSCSYFGEALPSTAEIVPSTDNVSGLIQRIVDAYGLSRNFEIRAALVPNAAAINLGSTRYILYNPTFMSEITTTTQDRWAAAGILAHEIGHHLNGHTLQAGGSRPPLELEADYFSGFILQKLGAQLADATAVIEKFAPETGSATHPGRRERVASITAGWAAACEKDIDCPKDAIPQDNLQNDKGSAAKMLGQPDNDRQKRILLREAQ
jgi:hypothetical protein